MHLTAFKKLTCPKMRDHLKQVGLDHTGKKMQMVNRYENWWDARPERSDEDLPLEPSNTPGQATSSTVPEDPVGAMAGILSRFLFPQGTAISVATADCLDMLSYDKKDEFELKDPSIDLSAMLSEVKKFVEQWLAVQREVKPATSSNVARNIFELEYRLNARISLSTSTLAIKTLFTNWGFHNVHSRSPSPNQLQLESADISDTKVGDDRVVSLTKEVEIIENAMRSNFAKWTASFPAESLDEVQWPTSFTTSEKKAMRDAVKNFMGPEMWAEERSSEEIADDVASLRNSDEFDHFPVAKGKAATIIEQIFKDVRNTKTRSEARTRSRSASSSEAATNSTGASTPPSFTSPVPLDRPKRSHDDEDDESEEAVHAHSLKRPKRGTFTPTRGRSSKRQASPLKRELKTRMNETEGEMDDSEAAT